MEEQVVASAAFVCGVTQKCSKTTSKTAPRPLLFSSIDAFNGSNFTGLSLTKKSATAPIKKTLTFRNPPFDDIVTYQAKSFKYDGFEKYPVQPINPMRHSIRWRED
jgi:hypothetical protein